MSAGPPAGDGSGERWTPRRRLTVVATIVAIGALIALLVVGLRAREVDASIDHAISRGTPKQAPDFTLPLLANGSAVGRRDEEPLSLSDLRGHPVVVNFWASWCDPCKREAPILETAWRAERAEGVVLLGVDVQDLSDDALGFVRRYGLTYPQVRDGGDGTYGRYGLTGIPETFFIDRAGRVRVHWIGEIKAEQLAAALDLIRPHPPRRSP
jgi:cytochrome c biogenesis protein CcmG/thiol:disulfide interchange protein DsbE